jgi:hypothetical protein
MPRVLPWTTVSILNEAGFLDDANARVLPLFGIWTQCLDFPRGQGGIGGCTRLVYHFFWFDRTFTWTIDRGLCDGYPQSEKFLS